jgi:cobyrinic acid a,c-diamide synthase
MFKTGPDYIDPSYHQLASGRPCRNLDTWMLPPEAVRESFQRNTAGADIGLIEGVMGLFDGFGATDDNGSTAELAALLEAPVILVLPVRGQARSAAATVLGFNTFTPTLKLSGILLNRVGSPKHAQLCQDAIKNATGVPVLGYLPQQADFHLPERHLGLIPTGEQGEWTAVLEAVGRQLAETADLDRLITIVRSATPMEVLPPRRAVNSTELPVRIGVAQDEAFSFTYPENLELLVEAGAEIIPFSPLHDGELPDALDGLILSGGFPEIYAEGLSRNGAMREAICRAAGNRLPIYAECGGLMYLTEAIIDQSGSRWPMVGALPGHSVMTERVTLGYRLVEAANDGPILAAGERLRGHEFHYSQWQANGADVAPAYHLLDPYGRSESKQATGIQCGSIWASYIHLHFLAKPAIARRFVGWCRERGKNYG